VLLEWVAEIADEPYLLDPNDHGAEIRANTWWLGASPAERETRITDEVAAAFRAVEAASRTRFAATPARAVPPGATAAPGGTATFYSWHDVRAGQLRCSVSTLPADHLPFGNGYRQAELAEVVAGYLDDQSPGFIPWADLRPVDPDGPPDDVEWPPLPVWTAGVGAGGNRGDWSTEDTGRCGRVRPARWGG
jgi:hypothetical protein